MKKIVLGILAHVDSGKTTLAEALLFKSGSIKKLGRVDNKDALLDTHEIEKQRGITVFSKQAILNLENTEISILDTPGHIDFSAEMERTLQVLDYAILVLNSSNGIQSHTTTLLKLLEKHSIPTFIFANKMDLVGTDREEILTALNKELTDKCIDFSAKDLFEKLSLCSENLMESYLENEKISTEEIALAVKNREVFPILFGSALKLEGIERLIEIIDQYTVTKAFSAEFQGNCFKISRDNQGVKLTYIKVTSGSLKVKDTIENVKGKINQIRIYQGEKFTVVNEVFQGDICALVGLEDCYIGQGFNTFDLKSPVLQPILTYRILLNGYDPIKAYEQLKILQEEDPTLNIIWNEKNRTINIQLMGEIQIEILETVIKERFGIDLKFGQGAILYKETISNVVEGVGHFEPLRHYAEVRLLLTPTKAGSGLTFSSLCEVDTLAPSWQNLIFHYLKGKPHRGVLTGSHITDMNISIVNGRSHKKHTEGGDFRQATYRALQQALRKAKSVLLEPYYDFTVTLPLDNLGRIMNDIQKMNGEFSPAEIISENAIIKGSAPVSLMRDYPKELAGYTKGKGVISCEVKGYFPCHNEKEVIANYGYDSTLFPDTIADSIFCANGSGFNVPWTEVEDYAHTPKYIQPKKEREFIVTRHSLDNFRNTLERDKELLKIFEKTYGEIKTDTFHSFNKAPKTESIDYVGYFHKEEYLLIDGYNIIFAWEELKELAKVSIDGARAKLIDRICNYQGFRQIEIVIVFDAYKVKNGTGSVEKHHNVNVVYTKEAETADIYIERTVKEVAKERRVRVATSDALEQMIIINRGASKVSAEQFKLEVEAIEDAIREFIN